MGICVVVVVVWKRERERETDETDGEEIEKKRAVGNDKDETPTA